jgi:hypothetical protein
MYFIVTTAMVALGLWMFSRASRIRRELARYEFEHRKDGGSVEFASFEDSERHRKRDERMGALVNLGVLLILVGGLGLLAGVLLPRLV